jgi:hypothetical protein
MEIWNRVKNEIELSRFKSGVYTLSFSKSLYLTQSGSELVNPKFQWKFWQQKKNCRKIERGAKCPPPFDLIVG